jgi:hypothetical protein
MARDTADAPLRRTFAQWYCVLAGASLLLAGVLGFAADGGFDTGSSIDGDNLIVFEVNGWHNLVHIGSGLLLLAAANYRPTAKTVAYVFGAVYGFVALWGLVDGDEVFNLIPVNPADNLLHIFLSAAAILCAYVSPTTKGQQRDRRARKRGVKEIDAPVTGGTTSGRVKAPAGSPNDAGIPTGRFERTTQDREQAR